jgi:hypothetical protein
MKKISIISLLIVVFAFFGQAQSHSQRPTTPQGSSQNSKSLNPESQVGTGYSKKNQEGASLKNLNYQLIKAKNLRNTGTVLSILGSVATIGGIAAINNDIFNSTGVLFVAGFLTTVAAIPIVITGSTRVRAIENEMVTRNRDSIVNIQLYNKAKVMRGAGLFLTVAGPIALATAVFLDINNNSAANPIYIAGAISTGVGIPLLIVGSKRVNKIVGGLTTHDAASLNIAPGFVYNNKTQNLYPGVTLRVRF